LYAALAVGAAGLYLSLPSPTAAGRRWRVAGGVLAAAALAAIAVYLTRWIGRGFTGRPLFIIFAVVAVAGSLRVVTHPRPVYSALYFVLVVLAVAVLCILAAAEFLGVALVIVYAGAILVTYVFVIMLAQQGGVPIYDRTAREPLAAVAMGFAVIAAATHAMVATDPIAVHAATPRNPYIYRLTQQPDDGAQERAVSETPRAINPADGNVRGVGRVLLTRYAVALEVAGVLLLVAMVGAIAIAQKRIEPESLTPEERRMRREDEDPHRIGREALPF